MHIFVGLERYECNPEALSQLLKLAATVLPCRAIGLPAFLIIRVDFEEIPKGILEDHLACRLPRVRSSMETSRLKSAITKTSEPVPEPRSIRCRTVSR
jgi:hypothetical protein